MNFCLTGTETVWRENRERIVSRLPTPLTGRSVTETDAGGVPLLCPHLTAQTGRFRGNDPKDATPNTNTTLFDARK